MCGIAGAIGLPGGGGAVRRMVAALAHRGPDNAACWEEGDAALGHARLAIVDLSPLGNQPMASEDGELLLAANGEIYNAPELRAGLEAEGHVFSSRSDNEVLLHLCERAALQGREDWPLELNGMFAFALWDRRARRLLLGRDRLGIKPLYYVEAGGGLVFASEIKGLLAHPAVRASLDPEGLAEYLAYGNTFGGQTLLRHVRMVEPGQTALFAPGGLRLSRYWDVAFREDAAMDFAGACEEYRATAAASVARHLMADVEVASYLSAGFDSTTVATLAQERLGGGIRTFTGGFDAPGLPGWSGLPDWYDETEGAQAVAGRIGSRHAVVRMNGADFAAVFDDLIHHLDEPRMGFGSFSQYMVAREAARSVKVILTGHGGDELFCGYPVFRSLLLAQGLRRGALGQALGAALATRPGEWPRTLAVLGQELLGGAAGAHLPVVHPAGLLRRMLQPGAAARLSGIDARRGLLLAAGSDPDGCRRLTRLYLKCYLPGLFVVEDKISMAHSLESRTPLCDNALVDLALRMPFALKLRGGELKAVPRAAMRGRLPELLYGLPKRGFPTPLRLWLRGDLAHWAEKRLLAPDTPLRSLFRARAVADVWSAFARGTWRRVRPLDELLVQRVWQLLCLDSFMRRHGLEADGP